MKVYAPGFRQKDTEVLSNRLRHQQSVELVGMKRVGINNFLRFYLGQNKNENLKDFLYISIDLNDLIEREVFPFWRLMFKRIVDATEGSDISAEYKKRIARLFLDAIQSGDLFMTYDGIRSSLGLLAQAEKKPTIIFTRFDRLKEAVTPEFFDNLQGLHSAAGRNLSYVFTSFRELEKLSPEVFQKNLLSGFTHKIYIKPASPADAFNLFNILAEQYELTFEEKVIRELVELSGGHVQYLRLILLILHELQKEESNYLTKIKHDERVLLQSEELWESLDHTEQETLKKIVQKQKISSKEKEAARYLWDTGIVTEENNLFSPLLHQYVTTVSSRQTDHTGVEFSRKEYLLFSLLKDNKDKITERERIIEIVWPEYQDFGVSDWSLDRLVARVRNKLKKQNSSMEIITVRTRGYKLVES